MEQWIILMSIFIAKAFQNLKAMLHLITHFIQIKAKAANPWKKNHNKLILEQ